MNRQTRAQRGQALVLIVLAIVGMVGLTGLAIDGGNAYSDRRHAQNAADTAALAAALARIRATPLGATLPPNDDWKLTGYNLAQTNGYPQSGPNSTVQVYSCVDTPQTPPCVLAAGADPKQFVHVVISSTVQAYFAPIFGIRQFHNTVQAIARATPPNPTPWVNGNALVALMTGCKGDGGWNQVPFDLAGDNVSVVNGNGVFVNSSCPEAFFDRGTSNELDSSGGVCVVGGLGTLISDVNPPPTTSCESQIDITQYQLPPLNHQDSCVPLGAGNVVDLGSGVGIASPGIYSAPFPPAGFNTVMLHQGIYCLENGLQITGGTLTTDWTDIGTYDTNLEGALFFIESGGVHVGGGATVNLHAINNSSTGLGPDLVGYLMYLPPTNPSDVTLIGGSSSSYVGTILAPASAVELNGGSGTSSLNLDSQIIGFSLKLAGTGDLNITYDNSVNATTYSNPALAPYK